MSTTNAIFWFKMAVGNKWCLGRFINDKLIYHHKQCLIRSKNAFKNAHVFMVKIPRMTILKRIYHETVLQPIATKIECTMTCNLHNIPKMKFWFTQYYVYKYSVIFTLLLLLHNWILRCREVYIYQIDKEHF